jgi:hypothetical protein
MSFRSRPGPWAEVADPRLAQRNPGDRGGELEVRVHAAALYVTLLKNGFTDEATEFAEWYLDTFDHDLED